MYNAAFNAGGREAVIEVRDQIESVAPIMRGNAKLMETLKDSMIEPQKRADVARNVFAQCNVALVEVLAVMAERGDVDLFQRVANAYAGVLSTKLGVTIVDVTTVVELDDKLRDLITKKAAADFGTDIVLREHIDKSILGGVLISANGKRLNASVRWQLDNARIALKKN
ncbi:MAG: ATP synthase F1 subunit delta [Coriobacteriia bacterium]|nr:ATP synthase F1 subunit delta [Coriobacteriia bacterium]